QQWPVDAIMVASTLRRMSPLLGMVRLRHRLQVGGDGVHLVPTHLRELPRALLVSRWKVVPTADAALAALADRGFDPFREVLLESDPGLAASAAEAAGSVSAVDVS